MLRNECCVGYWKAGYNTRRHRESADTGKTGGKGNGTEDVLLAMPGDGRKQVLNGVRRVRKVGGRRRLAG